jgi:hypothetical protein
MAASVVAVGTGIALAASPHFINASDSINFDNGNLTCSWKEAGLGNNQLVTYVCGASATATYVVSTAAMRSRRQPTRPTWPPM